MRPYDAKRSEGGSIDSLWSSSRHSPKCVWSSTYKVHAVGSRFGLSFAVNSSYDATDGDPRGICSSRVELEACAKLRSSHFDGADVAFLSITL